MWFKENSLIAPIDAIERNVTTSLNQFVRIRRRVNFAFFTIKQWWLESAAAASAAVMSPVAAGACNRISLRHITPSKWASRSPTIYFNQRRSWARRNGLQRSRARDAIRYDSCPSVDVADSTVPCQAMPPYYHKFEWNDANGCCENVTIKTFFLIIV